jgi:hypothetical protein
MHMINEHLLGLTNVDGVRILGHWAGSGAVHCLLEAPDAAAVFRYHATRQAACDELHALPSGAADLDAPSARHQSLVVSKLIAELWA